MVLGVTCVSATKSIEGCANVVGNIPVKNEMFALIEPKRSVFYYFLVWASDNLKSEKMYKVTR